MLDRTHLLVCDAKGGVLGHVQLRDITEDTVPICGPQHTLACTINFTCKAKLDMICATNIRCQVLLQKGFGCSSQANGGLNMFKLNLIQSSQSSSQS